MEIKHWKLIRNVSAFYVLVVSFLFIASLLVLGLVEYGAKPPEFTGCYAYDAMVIGFECAGFPGSNVLGLALNFPFLHLYLPFFILYKPIYIFAVIAIWFFPVMFVISIGKIRGNRT